MLIFILVVVAEVETSTKELDECYQASAFTVWCYDSSVRSSSVRLWYCRPTLFVKTAQRNSFDTT